MSDPARDEAGFSAPDALSPERLRGLSHPLRVRILTILQARGALTATGLARLVGESSGSTSYHLRQLARHGFVNEVEGRGTARERWWEAARGGFTISPDAADDVGTASAKNMVNAEFERARQENIWRVLRWTPDQSADAEEWRDAVTLRTSHLFATPAQMRALIAAVNRFIDEQTEGLRDQEGTPGARPIEVHFNALPMLEDDAR